ncbi:MAG: aldo/keto reductase [Opitutales bacterium]
MHYRSLGRTGVQVSPLCIGAGSFTHLEDEPFQALLGEAIDAGLNFIDTANIYKNGRDEARIGRALEALGKRDRMVVATKVEGPIDPDDPNGRGISRRHIIAQCEASLKRLRTDYIDLYQLHCSHGSTIPIDEPLRALDDLIRQGKIRYAGTSHYAAWQQMEAVWVARELGLNRFVCEQVCYHPLDRTPERELIPFALSYGHALILWSPLASGFLTGKYGPDSEKQPLRMVLKDLERAGNSQEVERTLNQAHRVMDVIRGIADEAGVSPAQWVLAWEMSQPGITAPIAGFRDSNQLQDNLKALDLTVSDEERAILDKVARPRMAVVPYNDVHGTPPLNSDWGPHAFRW